MIELNSSIKGKGFPVVDSNDICGGYMQFNSIEERNALDPSFIKNGMICYVNGKTYQYFNKQWNEIEIITKEMYNNILSRISIIETGLKIEGIELNSYSLVLKKEETFKLETKLIPENDFEDSIPISLTVDNKNIISIDDNNVITALSKGTATITASLPNPFIKATCTVHVTEDIAVGDDGITDGLVVKLSNSYFGDDVKYWKDPQDNYNAKLMNFDGDPFKNGCIQLRGKEYIELSEDLLNENGTIELYLDLLNDTFPEIKKLFAKKNSWNDMMYQVNTDTIFFGGYTPFIPPVKVNTLSNLDGLRLLTFTMDIENKVIKVYIDGILTEVLNVKEFGKGVRNTLLIGTNSDVDSSSNVDIYAIKIFDRILSDEEVKYEYDNITI